MLMYQGKVILTEKDTLSFNKYIKIPQINVL